MNNRKLRAQMLEELKLLSNQDTPPHRQKIAYERLEIFIRLKTGDASGVKTKRGD